MFIQHEKKINFERVLVAHLSDRTVINTILLLSQLNETVNNECSIDGICPLQLGI